MPLITPLAATPLRWLKTITACSLGLALLVPLPAHADDRNDHDALPFAKSYSITGNYVVGGVDLAPQPGTSGLVTGTISINGVPANADILAEFLYWETISTQISQVDGVKFRGNPVTVVQATSARLDGDAA